MPRDRSARRARPRAPARARPSTVRNALSAPSAAAMRSSAARQTSTADVRPDATASPDVRRGDRRRHQPSTRGTLKRPAARRRRAPAPARPRAAATAARRRRAATRRVRRARARSAAIPVGVDVLHLFGVGQEARRAAARTDRFSSASSSSRARRAIALDVLAVRIDRTLAGCYQRRGDADRRASVSNGPTTRDDELETARLSSTHDPTSRRRRHLVSGQRGRADARGRRVSRARRADGPAGRAAGDHCAARRADVLGAGRRVRLQGGGGAATYDVAVLVGPSHFVAFDGVALYPDGAFESPLGPAVDRRGGRARAARPSPIVQRAAVRARARALARDAAAVSAARAARTCRSCRCSWAISVARRSRRWPTRSSRAFAGRRALLVASTDLSHYFDAATAATLDARVQRVRRGLRSRSAARAVRAVSRSDERGRYVGCGGGPAIAVMMAARALGARDGARPEVRALGRGLRRQQRRGRLPGGGVRERSPMLTDAQKRALRRCWRGEPVARAASPGTRRRRRRVGDRPCPTRRACSSRSSGAGQLRGCLGTLRVPPRPRGRGRALRRRCGERGSAVSAGARRRAADAVGRSLGARPARARSTRPIADAITLGRHGLVVEQGAPARPAAAAGRDRVGLDAPSSSCARPA